MSSPTEQLFQQDPSISLPLERKGPEGTQPTITGRIFELNQKLAALAGRDAAPYISDTKRILGEIATGTPWKYPKQVLRLDTPNADENGYLNDLLGMAPGALSILLRFNNTGASLPMFGVKLSNQEESQGALFAVASNVLDAEGGASKSLSGARRINVPDHLQPKADRGANGNMDLIIDPNVFDNTRLVLGDAYHRAASLLGAPPSQVSGGHSAVDGAHNPGIHRIITAGNTGKVVNDPGSLLHSLHELRQLKGDRLGTLEALQEYFASLNIQRPMAPISVIRLGPDNRANTGIWLPSALLDSKTGAPLNISALAPTLSVIGTYSMLPGEVKERAVLRNPAQGLQALERGAGVKDIGNLL